jgi:hypothetical protein
MDTRGRINEWGKRRWRRVHIEDMFIKMNMVGADGAPGGRVPEDVSSMPNMTKEEAALRDIVILATCIFQDVGIHKATERMEVAHIWLATVEGFKGSAATE